jgi:predicted signal transduction protein with EAL and GGDEF domain
MLLDNPPRRPLDLKVRYGGEELVIVWHAISPAALPKLIDETLAAIRGVHVDWPDHQQPISVTASIGVTYLRPDETTKPQAIMAFADRLMYQAKAEGRNRAIIEPFVNARSGRRLSNGSRPDQRPDRLRLVDREAHRESFCSRYAAVSSGLFS